MPTVIIDLSISLDGFIAGPNDGPEHPLGTRGGDHIFDWYNAGGAVMHGFEHFRPVGVNREVVEDMFRLAGVMLTGRRTYDIAKGWGGRHPVNGMPVITVTHERPKNVPKGESRLEFAASYADGMKLAKQLAGDKAVGIGGASIAQQALDAGDVDEILLHVAPIVLGDGVRLFAKLERPVKLDAIRVIHGPGVVHHHYRVVK